MKKQNIRTLSLIVATFTYLLVGAAVFDWLESEHENDERDRLEQEEKRFKTHFNISEDEFENLTLNIMRSIPHKTGRQWKFSGALFFSTTVITTVGYGYSTPKTPRGKIFCMFYALIGIPLNLVMFQSIGERLNKFFTILLRNIKKCFQFKSTEVSQTNLILVCINTSSLVVAGGAYAFSYFESWTYLDAIYYCIITLTTIGFGDYVALQRNEKLNKKPEYIAFSLVFILFGLAVVSALMNLLVLRLLTMNTEDERKDELEAFAASCTAVRLDGDVITSRNGRAAAAMSLLPPKARHELIHRAVVAAVVGDQGAPASAELADRTSVCSCTCYEFRSNFNRAPWRWGMRESDGSDGGGGIGRLASRLRRGSNRRRKSNGYSLAKGSIIAQLLQPVKVLQAMTQMHANKDSEWLAASQNTVFGQRRNSI